MPENQLVSQQSPPGDVLADELAPIIRDLRARRKPIDENWLLFHHAHRGRHMRSFFKSDIFNHYLPAMRRSIERFVIRASQMLVPSSDFFEVFPATEDGDDISAESVKNFLSTVLTHRIKIYPFVRQLLRCYALYGRAICKSSVEIVDTQVRIKSGGKWIKQPLKLVLPSARVIDPFVFYCWPETDPSLERVQIIVEDIMMSYSQYSHMEGRIKGLKHLDQKDLVTPIWPESQTRRLSQQNMVTPDTLHTAVNNDEEKDQQLVGFVSISEVWFKKVGNWKKAWIVWNYRGGAPITVWRNDFPFPRSSYRMASGRDIPGEHYSTGMGDDLEPLQVLVNDQINMFLEGQAMLFSPPAAVNPDAVTRPRSIVMRPRAIWLMDPKGVTWLQPADTTKPGLQGIQFTLGMMDSFSGSNPLAEGQPTRNMPRAGFALSSMLNLSLADIKDAAQMIEDNILTPLLSDLYSLAVEFIPEDQIINIPGAQGMRATSVSMTDLYGEWSFKWVGSVQAQDTQVRAQRLIATLGMLAKLAPTMGPQLEAEGKTLDWEYIWRRVWRDALGERGMSSVIRKLTQTEQQYLQLQRQIQAAQHPPVKVSLSGQLDPLTAKLLSGEQTPTPLETLKEAGHRGSTSNGGRNPQAPINASQSQAQDIGQITSPTVGGGTAGG